MPPNRGNVPPLRRMLTRSLSARVTAGVPTEANICFWGTDVEEFGRSPPRFVVRAKMQYRDGIDRRMGMTGNKVAVKMKKGATRVPFASINTVKTHFDRLLVDDRGESTTSPDECEQHSTMKKFFYEMEGNAGSEAVCTCYGSDKVVPPLVQNKVSEAFVSEPNITATHAQTQEFTNAEGPFSCSVVNPQTGLKWVPKGRGAKVAVGAPTGLQCWILTGSMSHKQAYIFGYHDGSSWKYASVTPRGNRIAYRTGGMDPRSLNVDSDDEIHDTRAFYLKSDSLAGGEGAHLIPASSDEKFAVIFDDNRRLRVCPRDPNTHKWKIEVS